MRILLIGRILNFKYHISLGLKGFVWENLLIWEIDFNKYWVNHWCKIKKNRNSPWFICKIVLKGAMMYYIINFQQKWLSSFLSVLSLDLTPTSKPNYQSFCLIPPFSAKIFHLKVILYILITFFLFFLDFDKTHYYFDALSLSLSLFFSNSFLFNNQIFITGSS